ncbi:GNAT family N-acetyltransferase [bacterium]|nr:GNAT family N-acetyltransferase [bacterium]
MNELEWNRLKSWLLQYTPDADNLASPEGLTRLDLSGYGIRELPDAFGLLTKLTVLNLSGNKLSSLPESMHNLARLSNLDLRRNRFEALPKILSGMPLRSLNVSGNRLSEISVLQECLELRVLDLSNNNLSNVGGLLSAGNEIRTLNLSGNFIKAMDDLFPLLSQVERLNLSQNILTAIPASIASLQMIVELNLSDNRIAAIDEAFFVLGLEEVDLSSNKLTRLYLHDLDDLVKIVLDSNPLSQIEVDESFAPYLEEFSCDSCELEAFVTLPSLVLTSLCFSSNAIRSIPETIGQYEKLTKLDIDGNDIAELPHAMANLTRLQTLYIGENPLSDEAKKVIEVLHPEICDINMKTGITLEAAGEEDLPAMAELIGLLFAIEADFEIDYDKQLAGITKLYKSEGAEMLVAKHEGLVVGMVTMQRLISSAEGGYIGQIEDLVVKEDYRMMGVGSRLINKMRVIAQAHGYRRIQLAADVDNANALQFYNRRGFRRTNLAIYHFKNN